jgi:hypothetical protein
MARLNLEIFEKRELNFFFFDGGEREGLSSFQNFPKTEGGGRGEV